MYVFAIVHILCSEIFSHKFQISSPPIPHEVLGLRCSYEWKRCRAYDNKKP